MAIVKDDSYRSGDEKSAQKGVSKDGARIKAGQDASGSASKDSGTKDSDGGRSGGSN